MQPEVWELGSVGMTKVTLKGLNIRRNKAGKWYVSIRATGKPLVSRFDGTRDELTRHLASAEVLAAYAGHVDPNVNPKDRKSVYPDYSLGALIEWYKSPFVGAWQALRPRTQQDYEKVITFLRPALKYEVSKMTRADIVELRNRAIQEKYPKFSNDVISFLSAVFREAVDYEKVQDNIALGVRRKYKPSKSANRCWKKEEWEAVFAMAPPHLVPVLAIARWAGLRGEDIAVLKRSAYRRDPDMGMAICFEALKNGEHVVVGVVPALRDVLEEQTRDMLPDAPICRNSLGLPFPSANAMRKAWGDIKSSAAFKEKLPNSADLTLHGLRVTYASSVKEAGFDNQAVADAIGDASESMGKHYARGADKRINTVRIFHALTNSK